MEVSGQGPIATPLHTKGPPVVDADETFQTKVISMLTEMRTHNANLVASVNTLDTKFAQVLTEFEKLKNDNKALVTENISMK